MICVFDVVTMAAHVGHATSASLAAVAAVLPDLTLVTTPVLHELRRHWQAYGAGSGVVLVAAVASIPEKPPSTLQEWWTWMRTTLQTALPINRIASASAQSHIVTGANGTVTLQDQRTETTTPTAVAPSLPPPVPSPLPPPPPPVVAPSDPAPTEPSPTPKETP